MKLSTIALAGALALSSTAAFAQAGVGSGAMVPETSGTAVNGGGGVVGTTTNGQTTLNNGRTVGTSNRPTGGDASTQGAPTGAAIGATGSSTEPGAVRDGKTR